MSSQEESRRPPTLRDVARRANVSTQTISRVINGKDEVAEPTRQRILQVIQELDYQPNSLARSLVTSRSLVIGLVVPDISQPFYPEIARGIEDRANEAGFSIFLCNTAGDAQREQRALERLRGHRVAGTIICNSRLDATSLAYAAARGDPIVLVNREVGDRGGTVIWTGYDTGGALATEHLIAIGRRKIAYVGIDHDSAIVRDRLRGYRTALEGAEIPYDPRHVLSAPPTFQGGFTAMAAITTQRFEIDGLFAFNDLMAIGAMRYAATHGIAVPRDVAIVGFGGSEVAEMVTPALSTVVVPLYAIGTTAVDELFDRIHGTSHERRHVHVEPRLLVRGSSVPEGRHESMVDITVRDDHDTMTNRGKAGQEER